VRLTYCSSGTLVPYGGEKAYDALYPELYKVLDTKRYFDCRKHVSPDFSTDLSSSSSCSAPTVVPYQHFPALHSRFASGPPDVSALDQVFELGDLEWRIYALSWGDEVIYKHNSQWYVSPSVVILGKMYTSAALASTAQNGPPLRILIAPTRSNSFLRQLSNSYGLLLQTAAYAFLKPSKELPMTKYKILPMQWLCALMVK
jgi:hypothetical protein